MEDYVIEQAAEPDWALIGGGIGQYNAMKYAPDQSKYLCFVVKAPDGTRVGGAIGAIIWNWLALELMFIKEEYRSLDFGSRLLAAIEAEARQHGAQHVFLDTFSFQAPEFYKKYGYEVFGTLPDFPPGHQRFYMKKDL